MRRALILLWLALALVASSPPGPAAAASPPKVVVVRIDGMIDMGLAAFVRRALTEAAETRAAAVVLEINTHGGRVDAAVLIRDALLEADGVRTIAFVNMRAISAGALIAMACDTLVMADGSTIGAATPVTFGESNEPAPEKTVSYLRKEFRATAEVRGRPPLLAEAMVDADVEVPDVIAKGKLLTLTDREALQLGLANARAGSFAEALAAVDLAGASRADAKENWAEAAVRFLTHPWVSSLLMAIAMLGILVEIRTPGFGIPGAAGMLALTLFFWGHWLVALAGWEELLLVTGGLILLLVEALLLPGFGIAGVLGLMALVTGLGLSLFGSGATTATVAKALGQVALAGTLAGAGAAGLLRLLSRLPGGTRLILGTAMTSEQGYSSQSEATAIWRGKRGRSVSPLRPAGIAEFDGQRVDVVSDGDFLDPDEPIEVVRVEGNRIVVRRLHVAETPPNEKDS